MASKSVLVSKTWWGVLVAAAGAIGIPLASEAPVDTKSLVTAAVGLVIILVARWAKGDLHLPFTAPKVDPPKLLLLLVALPLLAGCGTIQGLVCKLDRQALTQNATNVDAIVELNEAYLKADPKPDSLKAAQHAQNAAAQDLAHKLAGE